MDTFNFITYYFDVDVTQDTTTKDYIYIYTITLDNNNKFSSYFIVPSIETGTLISLVGDNGVSFGNSQGFAASYSIYTSPNGYSLAMKNFFFVNYLDNDPKYCASNYEPLNKFIYVNKNNTTYNFSKSYNDVKYLMNMMCHMGDIIYGWEFIDYWKNYFKMFECINSIVPILYTVGNHEYYDGGATSYTYNYINYLLPFNVHINIPNNINDGLNRQITNNLRTPILNWQYEQYIPLYIISYVYSNYDNAAGYPGDPLQYQQSDLYDTTTISNLKIYFWHINNDGTTDNKYPNIEDGVIFYGHAHSTSIIPGGTMYLTGGFGNGQGTNADTKFGWCDCIQVGSNKIQINTYTNILSLVAYNGSYDNINYPDLFTLKNFNHLFNVKPSYYPSPNPKPPNPSKTKCCEPVIWNHKKECKQINTINSLKNNKPTKNNYWKFIKNNTKC